MKAFLAIDADGSAWIHTGQPEWIEDSPADGYFDSIEHSMPFTGPLPAIKAGECREVEIEIVEKSPKPKYHIVQLDRGAAGIERQNGDVAGFLSEESASIALEQLEDGTSKEGDLIWREPSKA